MLVRFGLVGGLVAGVHSALIWFCFNVAGYGERTSYWAGYFPAVALHFCLTKWWTFRCARRDVMRQLGRYAAVAAVAAGVQFAVYHVALLILPRTPYTPNLAYAIAAVVQMGLSFVLMKRGVFRESLAKKTAV